VTLSRAKASIHAGISWHAGGRDRRIANKEKHEMKLRNVIAAVAAASALACMSTSLHPKHPYGAYAVVLPANAVTEAQPLLDAMRGRFEKLDVVTDISQTQSSYRAVIVLKPEFATAAKAFAYEVNRFDFPVQKGVVTVADQTIDGLDRLVDDAGGRRGLTQMDKVHASVHNVAPASTGH
jgi:hypothetical protein